MKENSDHSTNFPNKQGKNLPIKHIHFTTIDSTNTWAKNHSDQWLLDGLTLVSSHAQTAGRGRFKRQWHSPANVNLYLSFCFWLPLNQMDLGHIPQLLALAAADLLKDEGYQPAIKWPNDILLKGKKMGGILCETILSDTQRGVVCGIGLNVNMSLEEAQKIDRPATSLSIESEQVFSLPSVQTALEQRFAQYLSKWLEDGFDPFFQRFSNYLYYQLGDRVCFHDNQKIVDAYFEKLLADGSIQLRLADGTSKIFYAGEFL